MTKLSTRALIAHLGQGLDAERQARLEAGVPSNAPALRGLLTIREVIEETPTERESPEEWLRLFFEYADSHLKQHQHDDSYGGGQQALQNALKFIETTAHALGLKIDTRD